MMSAHPARPTPPPRQNPWTDAITGTWHSYTAANAAAHPRFTPTSAAKSCAACEEPATARPEYHCPHALIVAEGAQRSGQLEPAGHRERVHWRMVKYAFGDTIGADG
jgi:hypothetical protein